MAMGLGAPGQRVGRRRLLRRRDLRRVDNDVEVSVALRFVVTYQVDGWTALGDPTRRAIFERLADRPRAVGELARELPVSRPAVSQHLKVLKDAGLVVGWPEGTRRIYQLRPEGIDALRAELDRFWNQSLANFKAIVEQPSKENA
jgi:DNA-binding transcriptional ArsR family regulator